VSARVAWGGFGRTPGTCDRRGNGPFGPVDRP